MDINYDDLRRQVKAREAAQKCRILKASKSDIMTYDLIKRQPINYHLIPPSKNWLQNRFIWADSIVMNSTIDIVTYTNWLTRILLSVAAKEPDMFLCLRHIIFMHETDMPLLDRFKPEILSLNPRKWPDILPNFKPYLGLYWRYMSCLIVNMTAIEAGVAELVGHDPYLDANQELAQELRHGIGVTLLHELRHLGLEANPLRAGRWQKSEQCVEQWARSTYEATARKPTAL